MGTFGRAPEFRSGADLALAMVEEDHGHELALEVARRMVLFLRRPGGQSQFSSQLAAQAAEHHPIRELVAWIVDNLDGNLSVPILARRAGMSERNFGRIFQKEVGLTPARFVAQQRLEAARRMLEETGENVETIALGAGFGDGEALRRALQSSLRVSPAIYRKRFGADENHRSAVAAGKGDGSAPAATRLGLKPGSVVMSIDAALKRRSSTVLQGPDSAQVKVSPTRQPIVF
jgi:transcriptional regulator GlxA family with amidase domain